MEEKDRESWETAAQSLPVSRRSLFQIVAAAPVVTAFENGAAPVDSNPHTQMAMHAAGPRVSHGPYQRKVFDDTQWRTVRILCDLIIPADERSGSATEAGVPEFLDDWIDFRKKEDGDDRLEAQILGGLMWLDRTSMQLCDKPFVYAPAEQQKLILDRIAWPGRAFTADKPWVQFFNSFRDLTVAGFFSSKMGIADLPYLGNTAVPEWKGCDTKVWALIEDRIKNGYKGLSADTTIPIG